jgi:hypothetical protein
LADNDLFLYRHTAKRLHTPEGHAFGRHRRQDLPPPTAATAAAAMRDAAPAPAGGLRLKEGPKATSPCACYPVGVGACPRGPFYQRLLPRGESRFLLTRHGVICAWSSSPGQLPSRGPRQIRTRRFPPSGSSVVAARGAPLPPEVTMTCVTESKLGHGSPPEARHHTCRLCSAGSEAATSLPGVNARMQPSDSPAASTGALVPLAVGLPRDERFSEPAGRAFAYAWRVGRSLVRVLRRPALPVDRQGPPRLLGRPLAHAPRSAIPPRKAPPRPFAVAPSTAFRVRRPLGFPGISAFSGPYPRGSHARLPTHQPSRYRGGCKAGYRPAGLSFSRAGFAPAGRQTEFHEVIASLLPDQHCLVALRICARLNPHTGGSDHLLNDQQGLISHNSLQGKTFPGI